MRVFFVCVTFVVSVFLTNLLGSWLLLLSIFVAAANIEDLSRKKRINFIGEGELILYLDLQIIYFTIDPCFVMPYQ